jgi:hypothetical protein
MRNSLHSSFSQGRNLPCSSDQANTARAAKLEPFSVQVFYSPDKAGRTAVNFIVDDLDKDLAGLASKGITATEPQEVSQGRQRLATIADADGNQLSLIEQVLRGR